MSGAEGRDVDDEALALAAGELRGLRAAGAVARSADTLLDQLTHLKDALDTALDTRNRHQPGMCTISIATIISKQDVSFYNDKIKILGLHLPCKPLLSSD